MPRARRQLPPSVVAARQRIAELKRANVTDARKGCPCAHPTKREAYACRRTRQAQRKDHIAELAKVIRRAGFRP